MDHRFVFSDEVKWGKLVKSWATGKNYFGGASPIPLPRTLDELKLQCNEIGLTLKCLKA